MSEVRDWSLRCSHQALSLSFLMTPGRKSFAPLCHHLFLELQAQCANADAISRFLRARDALRTAHRVAFAFLDTSLRQTS